MIVDEVGRNPPGLLTTDPLVAIKIGAHREMRTSSIEKTQRIRVVTNHDRDSIIIEHLRDPELRRAIHARQRYRDSQLGHIHSGICL